MSTADIRAILFKVAKEFKTTDDAEIAEIDSNIEIAYIEADIDGLGDKVNLGVALLTAYNLTEQAIQSDGKTGLIVSEKTGDEEVRYANSSSKTQDSEYTENTYGKRYKALLKPIKRRKFSGFVT